METQRFIDNFPVILKIKLMADSCKLVQLKTRYSSLSTLNYNAVI